MKSLVLSKFSYTYLPLIALVIFVTVFAVMLIWTFRKNAKEVYKEAQNIPLNN